MKSFASERFWKCYESLPDVIKRQSKNTYSLFEEDPYHPSLHFKHIHSTRPIFSVRISMDYRAVGIVDRNEIVWFWIGSHADYDNLLNHFKK